MTARLRLLRDLRRRSHPDRVLADAQRSVVQAARWQGLALEGLTRFRAPTTPTPPRDALVVAYGTPPDHSFTGALDALMRALPPGE
ncbi:hypothetical protein [Streptomyces sp. NPDC058989]|uniref:hypothetical protein n=1 Tax=Streptomyces sp. NPDC058989 TaxID=3346686 RepID=UPI003690E8BB